METPLISIILATYNGARFLSETIDSVLSQDYSHFELIIIDDASTDYRVGEIIDTYTVQDHRIIWFRNEKNRERSWSKNFWVSQAKGLYIAFVDDDDTWESTKLSKQIQVLLSEEDIWMVGTFARFVNESGEVLSEANHLKTDVRTIKNNILLSNQFIHSSVLLRKEIFQSVWGFREELHLCEDYELWLRILEKTGWKNIPESLVDYRVRTSSTTAKNIYRMKYFSILFAWKYRSSFSMGFRSLFIRIVLFPFNTLFLMKIWKRLFWKRS